MLELKPCDFATARAFVGEHHRHNKPPVGHKFSVAVYDGDRPLYQREAVPIYVEWYVTGEEHA